MVINNADQFHRHLIQGSPALTVSSRSSSLVGQKDMQTNDGTMQSDHYGNHGVQHCVGRRWGVGGGEAPNTKPTTQRK